MPRGVNDQDDIAVRIAELKSAHDGNRRIRVTPHTADDLPGRRVILFA